MDFKYCYEKCDIGKKACEELLKENESVFAAVGGFYAFAEMCFKTCPYKDKHIKEESK